MTISLTVVDRAVAIFDIHKHAHAGLTNVRQFRSSKYDSWERR
jgi:hypothetical protein